MSMTDFTDRTKSNEPGAVTSVSSPFTGPAMISPRGSMMHEPPSCSKSTSSR